MEVGLVLIVYTQILPLRPHLSVPMFSDGTTMSVCGWSTDADKLHMVYIELMGKVCMYGALTSFCLVFVALFIGPRPTENLLGQTGVVLFWGFVFLAIARKFFRWLAR